MIIEKERINELPEFIAFQQQEHKKLSILFLAKIANEIDFKLKIQKASIQLVSSQTFAVIGLRGSQAHIFVEFYSETKLDSKRIIKTIKNKNGYMINRVNIAKDSDIDAELIQCILHSRELIN